MALHQYIGARYVPVFYQNSLDPTSTEWEPNVSYEPLVIVTLPNLHSYISKKYVPDTVGSPALNAEYWYDQGYANAYIQALQDQIDDMKDGTIPGSLQNEINVMQADVLDLQRYPYSLWHNKKVVVYGDSLSTVTYNYWQYMVAEDPTIDLTNRAVGGTRIFDGYTLLQAANDLADFDLIVLAYGTNSWAGTTYKTMIEKYIDCFNEISTKAPKSQIVCIAPYYSYDPAYGPSTINDLGGIPGYGIFEYCAGIVNICNMYGGVAFNLYELAGVNQYNYTDWLELSGTKYVHENEALGRKIAKILLTTQPTTTPTFGYTFVPVTGSNNGFLFIRQGSFVAILQRGSIAITDLLALDLTHVCPAFIMTGWGRGRQTKTMALVALNGVTGEFSINWNSATDPADTEIQGINIFGIFGNWQPH